MNPKQPEPPLRPRLTYQPQSFPETPLPRKSGRSRTRIFVVLLAIIIVIAGGATAVWKFTRKTPATGTPKQQASGSKTDNKVPSATGDASHPNRIRLLATGDFIAHDALNERAKKSDGSYDYLQFMSDFKPVFAAADIRFCNQATVSAGEAFGISGYPIFNAPTQFAKDMGSLGCNLVNTASNHSFDKGQDAIDATVKVWDGIPNLFAVAGENRSTVEQNKVHYFTVKGVKFAFLAYTTYTNTPPPNTYGVNVFSKDFAKKQIDEAKQNGAEAIVTSMRWGTEYSPDVNAEQTADSQYLADQGVSLILGHGPHVLQTVKRLKGAGGNETLVWYSLGNFINAQEPPETLFNGLAVIDYDTKTKQISTAQYLPIYMHYEWTADQKARDDLLARKNFHLYLLEDADAAIARSQLGTTASAQKTRIQNQLNAFTSIPLITSKEYYQ
jgi:poly-gamma-glutamate capsule biosynthesis protein CapA/YwtB (metallophosphatase superfamily)